MSVCKKCGADVPPGVRFCSGCGAPVSESGEPGRIVLKCRDCNGVMTMDKEGEMLTCPYCGSKELIRNSDTVAVEKIRQQTEFKKWEREDLKEEQQKKEAKERSYKFGAFGVISIICAVLFGLMAAVQFTHIQNGWSVFAGLIAVSGVLVFSASVILRRGIVKIDKGYLATVLMIGGFLLLIPYFMVSSAAGIASSQAERVREEKEFKWPNSALAQLLPTPKSHFGKVTRDSADCLTVNVAKTTQADFDEYVEQCREKGFTENYEKSEFTYDADNADLFHLHIYYYDSLSEMNITLEAPAEDTTAEETEQTDDQHKQCYRHKLIDKFNIKLSRDFCQNCRCPDIRQAVDHAVPPDVAGSAVIKKHIQRERNSQRREGDHHTHSHRAKPGVQQFFTRG